MPGHVEAHDGPLGVQRLDERVEQLEARADPVDQHQRQAPGRPGAVRDVHAVPEDGAVVVIVGRGAGGRLGIRGQECAHDVDLPSGEPVT